MIIHELKLVFIHITKCGGTSVEKSLFETLEPSLEFPKMEPNQSFPEEMKHKYNLYISNQYNNESQHSSFMDYKSMLGDKWEDYTYFTTTRDPLQRAISEFTWQKRIGLGGDHYKNDNINHVIETGTLWARAPFSHKNSMFSYLKNEEGVIEPRIHQLKLEDINSDWNDFFSDVLGMEAPNLSVYNKSRSVSDGRKLKLTKESKNEIKKRWGRDFTDFEIS